MVDKAHQVYFVQQDSVCISNLLHSFIDSFFFFALLLVVQVLLHMLGIHQGHHTVQADVIHEVFMGHEGVDDRDRVCKPCRLNDDLIKLVPPGFLHRDESSVWAEAADAACQA